MNILNLNFPKSICERLSIQSVTTYDDSNEHNVSIRIKPPKASNFFTFLHEKNWCSMTLDCHDFGICCDELTCLPDGNYEIEYKVNSDILFINHFRVCNLLKTYFKALCVYLNNKYTYAPKKIKEIQSKLKEIYSLIQLAVWSAEDCLNVKTALEIYNEAADKLNEIYDSGTCSTCS